jgi:multicomponent K+:H+ antiporter subunit E
MKPSSRWLPHPLAALALWAAWLLLNNTLALAHVLLGALLGLAIPALTRALWPERIRFRRPGAFLRLLAIVLYDIVVANVNVARLILGPVAPLRPAFVKVPLDLRNPFAVSALASIVTLTPGTVSAAISADRRSMLVHTLDLDDEATLTATIKARYEAPLKEILEC